MGWIRVLNVTRPERELTSGRCSIVKKFVEPFNGEIANDGRKAGASPTYGTKASNQYCEGSLIRCC